VDIEPFMSITALAAINICRTMLSDRFDLMMAA
jgi:hypothetical protein